MLQRKVFVGVFVVAGLAVPAMAGDFGVRFHYSGGRQCYVAPAPACGYTTVSSYSTSYPTTRYYAPAAYYGQTYYSRNPYCGSSRVYTTRPTYSRGYSRSYYYSRSSRYSTYNGGHGGVRVYYNH